MFCIIWSILACWNQGLILPIFRFQKSGNTAVLEVDLVQISLPIFILNWLEISSNNSFLEFRLVQFQVLLRVKIEWEGVKRLYIRSSYLGSHYQSFHSFHVSSSLVPRDSESKVVVLVGGTQVPSTLLLLRSSFTPLTLILRFVLHSLRSFGPPVVRTQLRISR